VPFTSVRYQAQMMGDPVESVSGDLWPKTLIMLHLGALAGAARLIGRVRGNVMGGCDVQPI